MIIAISIVGVYLALGVVQFGVFLYTKYPELAGIINSQEETRHVRHIKSWVYILSVSFYLIVLTWPSYVWVKAKTLH